MGSSRRRSEETVLPDNESVWTALSDDTLADLSSQVFGIPLSGYSTIKEYQIVSTFLHPGVQLYASSLDIEKGVPPVLSTQSSVFSVFKKNAPFMTICTVNAAHQPEEYCRVHFKNVAANLSCYILTFSDTTVVVLNNGLRPAADIYYQNTKLRVVGSSGANSTFASGELKMYVLQPSCWSLTDGFLLSQPTPGSVKGIRLAFDSSANELCRALYDLKKHNHAKALSEARPLVSIPLVSYTDTGDEKIPGLKHTRNGYIKVFEPQGNSQTKVMLCIMLVLREQEMRKSKGGKRPSYVEH